MRSHVHKENGCLITLTKLYLYKPSSSEANTSNKFVSSEPELADSLTDHTDGKGGSSFTIQTTVLGHSIHDTRVFTGIYTIK